MSLNTFMLVAFVLVFVCSLCLPSDLCRFLVSLIVCIVVFKVIYSGSLYVYALFIFINNCPISYLESL